jgi:hypothetical protein
MAEKRPSLGESLVYAAAGLADMAYGHVEEATRRVNRQLRRADLKDMARDGHEDLMTRGKSMEIIRLKTAKYTVERRSSSAARWPGRRSGRWPRSAGTGSRSVRRISSAMTCWVCSATRS